mgnify:FL=1
MTETKHRTQAEHVAHGQQAAAQLAELLAEDERRAARSVLPGEDYDAIARQAARQAAGGAKMFAALEGCR